MMNKLFLSLIKIIFYVISKFLAILVSLLNLDSLFPDLAPITNVFTTFWNYVFYAFDWLRACFLIPSSSLSIFLDILIVKFTYKPFISIVKIFLNWIKTPGGR